ncbi:hypothetical protein MAPG_05886 [Magnaporthiopsis poae ATCC 64411]|uniref:C2H2-type domain-containing protein n=1 Tax=Magnaporthiopsis poae (strain ATCC 64411 / 73-15) TaxID=644358 RepID=A0A0C4E0K7_MAGP6|nr:hypothetical protein MAPG_05886 [Magnaporthiopsis poae ATCC 64411]
MVASRELVPRSAERTTEDRTSPAPRKQITWVGNDIGVEDDDDVSERGHETRPLRYLACPFYKHDASAHMDCARFRLRRVRDVKQHLHRCHSRHMQCPVCGDEFRDSPLLETHIRKRKCREPPGGFRIQGVTALQGKLLSRRVKRKAGEESQWFGIWDILFPRQARPKSPYLANELDEFVNTVRHMWQRQRRDIVDSVLAKGVARTALIRGAVGNNGDCPYAAAHGHVMELSEHVLNELICRIQLDSRRSTEPAPSTSNTGCKNSAASISVEREPGNRGQDAFQCLEQDLWDSRPWLGEPSDIGEASTMTTCSTSATPQLGLMAVGFPSFAEDTLLTFGNPAGDSYSPDLAFSGPEPYAMAEMTELGSVGSWAL